MGRNNVFLSKVSEKYNRQKFIEWLFEEEKAEETVASYVLTMDMFFESESKFSKDAIVRFKQRLMKKVSPKTVNLRLCGIKAYADWMGIPISIKHLKTQQRSFVENVITQEQYEYLLRCLKEDKNEKWYIVIKFLACTGARVSELIQFKKKHLDGGEAELFTKGKIRTIYIPQKLVCECQTYFVDLNPEDYLFSSRYGQITTRGIAAMLQKFAERYQIPKEVMHPHSFRHRFAINFLEQNNNLSLLSDLLGHSGVNTTMIYLRKSKEEQRKTIDDAVNW